jgi:hypothetical protein
VRRFALLAHRGKIYVPTKEPRGRCRRSPRLAESLPTFTELNDVMQRWMDLQETEGVDIEDYDAESPAFKAIRASAKALVGRVHACGDYEDTLPVLAGGKVSLRGEDPIAKLGAAREWLALSLHLASVSRKEALRALAKERGLTREASARPSSLLYALLCHSLLDDSEALDVAIAKAAKSPAEIVRRAVELVTAVRSGEPGSSSVAWVAGLAPKRED